MMNLNKDDLVSILKSNSLRVTKSRLAVLNTLLSNKKQYLTPEEIFHSIAKSNSSTCDQVSVYRNLTTFSNIGIVKKSEFNKDASRYSWNADEGEVHEHYFKCIKCQVIEPFHDCFFAKKEKELETKGYRNLNHHVEITGICPSCVQ